MRVVQCLLEAHVSDDGKCCDEVCGGLYGTEQPLCMHFYMATGFEHLDKTADGRPVRCAACVEAEEKAKEPR